MSAQDYIYCYQGKALRVAGGTAVVGLRAPAYETYFDFGNTYTLTSSTAADIPITSYISSADRRCLVFYFETNVTANIESGTAYTGLSFVSSDNGTVNFGLYSGLFGSGGIFAKCIVSGSSVEKLSQTATDIVKIKLIYNGIATSAIEDVNPLTACDIYIQYDAGCWGASTPSPILLASADGISRRDPRNISSISSPGGREGKFSATNFKCAGFDTIGEAKAWMI